MKHIASCSFGKDSLATIILAKEHGDPLDEIVYVEVMFDREISGEPPEHRDFIYNVAIPRLESWGYPVTVLRADKTYEGQHTGIRKNCGRGARVSKLKEFLQWNLENPHNLNFKMIVSYEDREETLKEMQDIVNILDAGLTLDEINALCDRSGNGGWIPVEERLPEYNNEDYYESVNVTLLNGTVTPAVYRNLDNEWWVERKDGEKLYGISNEVIAWRPLPEPYIPERKIQE